MLELVVARRNKANMLWSKGDMIVCLFVDCLSNVWLLLMRCGGGWILLTATNFFHRDKATRDSRRRRARIILLPLLLQLHDFFLDLWVLPSIASHRAWQGHISLFHKHIVDLQQISILRPLQNSTYLAMLGSEVVNQQRLFLGWKSANLALEVLTTLDDKITKPFLFKTIYNDLFRSKAKPGCSGWNGVCSAGSAEGGLKKKILGKPAQKKRIKLNENK